MTGFNLFAWPLRHRAPVIFMVAAIMTAGIASSFNLDRSQDPTDTLKTMIISVALPCARAVSDERCSAGQLNDLTIPTASGQSVPLAQIAAVTPAVEDGLIRRRNRDVTQIVRSDVIEGVQAPDVSNAINPRLDEIRESLPSGYRIEMGGAVEESAKGGISIAKLLPLMLGLWLTLLMVQLQSFSRTVMVLLTAQLD